MMNWKKRWSGFIALTGALCALPQPAFAAEEGASTLSSADMGFMAFAALMVFFMTPALGFFYGG